MKKLVYSALALALTLVALPVFAQQRVDSVQDAGSFVTNIISDVAVPVIFALAFIVFIWGIFLYFIAGGHDEEKRKSGKQLMLWGILGFFIMISVWGLVNILVGSVNLDNEGPSDLPQAVEVR
ncbi:MAG TPA: pilin [Candidatus Paceibacterota bacterium]